MSSIGSDSFCASPTRQCRQIFHVVRPPRPSICLFIQTPRYLMNGLSNLDETYSEYSQAPTDNLIRCVYFALWFIVLRMHVCFC